MTKTGLSLPPDSTGNARYGQDPKPAKGARQFQAGQGHGPNPRREPRQAGAARRWASPRAQSGPHKDRREANRAARAQGGDRPESARLGAAFEGKAIGPPAAGD